MLSDFLNYQTRLIYIYLEGIWRVDHTLIIKRVLQGHPSPYTWRWLTLLIKLGKKSCSHEFLYQGIYGARISTRTSSTKMMPTLDLGEC